ncbi:MAG: type VII secretion protein EssC [Lachnospiraceae bacterium]|nr:type VII secretion protein EssC [Lachnospiraceae bacterium]
MSMILSVHSSKAFQEFLLPAVNNSEYSVFLDNDIFSLPRDIELSMEIIENCWYFTSSDNYRMEDTISHEGCFGRTLKDGDLLTVILPGNEHISIMVDEMESSFKVFEKYDIQEINAITVGRNENNDICYNTRKLVSGEHAVIHHSASQCVIEDKSANGVFVNSRRIVGSRQLEFGDCINIFGLCLVYLGHILAVNSQNEGFQVNSAKLKKYLFEKAEVLDGGSIPVSHRKTLYHRSPRQIHKIDDDVVEIEAPPQPKTLHKKPLGLLIGPSMTMALPMLLGCGLSIYSTRVSGRSGSAFMYTGLVTAVSSALIGMIWAIVNLNADKKKNREEELHRFEAYGEYLIKCANQIKDKYEKNTNSLNAMYLSAGECCGYDEKNISLWNRNANHKDFLCHRLGTGDMPFQAQINIPKEKFTLINDSLAEKPAMIRDSYQDLHNVPICVDMLRHRLIGIVGGTKKKGAVDVMHSMAAQIAASNCYTDVKMAFIYDEGNDDASDWEYMKWFPHVWSEDKKSRYVAGNRIEAGDVLYEITNVLRTRAENRGSLSGSKEKLPSPQFIIFVSEPALLEGELITKYITDEKNEDIITFFLTDSYENLPNACEYIIQNDGTFQGMYSISDDIEERRQIAFDHISNLQLEKLARVLANIEVHETESGGDIPSSLTFFDMYGVNRLEELNVLDKWRKNRTYDSMKAVIGQKAGGGSWYLDIHEKYHGPHGLIAGTTGSGKSETLQTYILSLALNFSPDDVGFFIIDYKGGGMANLFNGLPHMIGQISNLSGNQVKRAMVSIKSENKRRQRIFNEHGVNNINLYTRLYKNNEASLPVPHMFIIIDEFAELKREEPDFMRELISVAQVGRSLGVHLILATQKPSGTVDDNIWSNSKFRLCLRVQDRQDSNDMLHRPDAAYITQAGRCYMQVGNDELFELFQSGFSGAAYDDENGSLKSDIAHMLSTTGKAALIGNRLKLKQTAMLKKNWIAELLSVLPPIAGSGADSYAELLEDTALLAGYMSKVFDAFAGKGIDFPCSEYNTQRVKDLLTALSAVWQEKTEGITDDASHTSDEAHIEGGENIPEQILAYADRNKLKLPEKKQKTQLDAVVEYLAGLAGENGYVHNLQLWLPVLPTVLYLCDLPSYKKADYFDGDKWHGMQKEWNIEVLMGLYDDPVNQAQESLTLNLSQNGHHAVIGTVVSGKSTFLQTFVYCLVNKYSPQEINVYAIDFSAKMLAAFEKMPHVGGVMYENDDERLAKFFTMLGTILEERKKLFKGGNYSQYVRVNGVVIPSIIIVIDNYSNFKNKTNNIYEDMILQLSKDGVSYGIFLVVTAGGFGALEIPGRIGDNLRTVVCLEMSDKFQYADALRTMHIDTLPEVNIKGRGLAKVGEQLLEFQTALSFESEDDFKRMEQIERLADLMSSKWKGKRAKAIPEIPEKPIWTDFAELEDVDRLIKDDRHLPIGYNMKNAAIYGLDLSRTYCYLITGRSRSGKTNLLKVMLMGAVMRDADVAVIDFNGDLTNIAEKESLSVINTDEQMFAFFSELLLDFKERNARKKNNVRAGMSDEEIYADMCAFKAKFIFIANFADFVYHVTHPGNAGDVRPFVENLLDRGSLHNVFLAACYNQEDSAKAVGTRLYDYFIKYKTGIHFGGNVAAQRIMNFDYVPYAEQSKAQKPGIGMLPSNDEEDVRKIVVPLMKG